jgi:hypothetical protein
LEIKEKVYLTKHNITFVDILLLFRDLPTMWRLAKNVYLHTQDWPMGMRREEFYEEYDYPGTEYLICMIKGRAVFLKKNQKYERSIAATLASIFVEQDYIKLNVKDASVLDIGSSYGDTAIYFSLNGAKIIEGYEIEKEFCDIAEENLKENNITNIIIRNEIANSDTVDRFAKTHKGKKCLKIDCEGGEYEQILNAKSLIEYDQVIIEYHYGYLNLEKRLEAEGFTVRHTRPKYGPGNMQMGLLYAYREQQAKFKQFNV